MMRALVVFESMFGNTQTIANAIADGLSARVAVGVVEVGDAPTVIDEQIDLIVVGGPTHAFGLSRPATRQSAADQAVNGVISAGSGLREWLAAIPEGSSRVAVATFDTRVDRPHLPGSAARAAQKRLRRLGLRVVLPSESFSVTGTEGPLVDGELERVVAWGEKLAVELGASKGDRSAS
jgi:Flavodoxin